MTCMVCEDKENECGNETLADALSLPSDRTSRRYVHTCGNHVLIKLFQQGRMEVINANLGGIRVAVTSRGPSDYTKNTNNSGLCCW